MRSSASRWCAPLRSLSPVFGRHAAEAERLTDQNHDVPSATHRKRRAVRTHVVGELTRPSCDRRGVRSHRGGYAVAGAHILRRLAGRASPQRGHGHLPEYSAEAELVGVDSRRLSSDPSQALLTPPTADTAARSSVAPRGMSSSTARFGGREPRSILGRPNKGMKLTRPERIGASQLIPGVRRTWTGPRCGPSEACVAGCPRVSGGLRIIMGG